MSSKHSLFFIISFVKLSIIGVYIRSMSTPMDGARMADCKRSLTSGNMPNANIVGYCPDIYL